MATTEASVAKQIGATLTFHKGSLGPNFSFEGRWGDTTQPNDLAHVSLDIRTVDIPIGLSRELNMVIKYQTDIDCYGFNI